MSNAKVLVMFLATLVLVMRGNASAGTSPQSTTATIVATVLDDCTVAGAIGQAQWTLNFGAYQFGASVAVNFATVLYCTKGTVINSVTLDNGQHYAAASRNMSNGAAMLPYTIYAADCGSQTLQWTGSNTPSVFQSVTSTSVRTPIGGSACGVIPAGSNAPAGLYTDIVTLTVNFT